MESVKTVPAEQSGAPRTWCRLQLVIAMVPPAQGKLLCIDFGPYTRKITVCLPKLAMQAIALAVVSSHPAVGAAVQWVRSLFG